MLPFINIGITPTIFQLRTTSGELGFSSETLIRTDRNIPDGQPILTVQRLTNQAFHDGA